MTLLTSIFKKLPSKYRHLSVKDFLSPVVSPMKQEFLGHLYFACVDEQVEFLAALWSVGQADFPIADEVRGTFRAICKAGMIPFVLDPSDPKTKLAVKVATCAYLEAKGKL